MQASVSKIPLDALEEFYGDYVMNRVYRLDKNLYMAVKPNSEQHEPERGNLSRMVDYLLSCGISETEIETAFRDMFENGHNYVDFGINNHFIYSYSED